MNKTRRALNKGDILFKEGDVSDCAYLLVSGLLESMTVQNGNDIILGEINSGELIGEMSVIDNETRSATVVAKENSVVVVVLKNQLIERIVDADPIVRSLLMGYSRRYRRSLAALKGEQRTNSDEQTNVFDRLSIDKIKLEYQLKNALRRNEIDVRYQPILEVATNEIVGYEALVRWKHPDRGFISPLEFIALAEETTLIVEVGEFVIDSACAAVKEFRRYAGNFDPFISINISPKQLAHAGVIERMVERIDAADLPQGSLKIEITESSSLVDSEIEHVIELCHEHGIKVALDNFGTGSSNLAMMHKMHFDTLNIDQSFTKNMQQDARSMTLVNMIINMGYALHADVLIGGIESEEMLDFVRELNCRYAQGYHIGKPKRLADIINQTVVNKILSIGSNEETVTQITLKEIAMDTDI